MKNIKLGLENIRSLYNIGAIIRSSVFFDIDEIFLIGYSGKDPNEPDLVHRKIEKTSLGSSKYINLNFYENINELAANNKNTIIIGIENNVNNTDHFYNYKFDKDSDYIMILGNEVDGLSDEALTLADAILEIPREGNHSSLNVATTAGIVLSYTSYNNNV